ncbi:acetyl-CoA carboxylase biotin carboxylase subunit [Candidatus Bipolaricaulota bacterium]|nr:acetyl-CoA carboxylase biotin carboxylase subunit [Candidatus Bipolaricaulota bacterium]MBS3825366.1 acetyl-CoA carboxylase biotin carboxylase subunit [Candidatus Bipolaricaulota bacterium]
MEKILVANRGEIALRIIEAARELGLSTVAIYSKPDKNQLHVDLADEAYCIGPKEPKESYLNLPSIIGAADISGADAIHPGYGFLSENSHFAEICEGHDIKFIGPPSSVLETAGDKLESKKVAEQAGAEVLPGTKMAISSEDELREEAKNLEFPLILKAAYGGGGRGMRLARNEEELVNGFQASSKEAEISFGDGSLYLEQYLNQPKHIEVQVIADEHGNYGHVGERECSTQRRHQKIIEEAPAPGISQSTRDELRESALEIAREFDYSSLGTVEFLVDDDENYYFMELNARIQVEHPVSEEISGVNLVKEQIKLAQGEDLEVTRYSDLRGHSMEFRINAEDPKNEFMPSSGRIDLKQLPGGHGVRFDTWIYDGAEVFPYYDSLLGKLIVTADRRYDTITKAISALRRFRIEGVKTNVDLHLDLIRQKKFRTGDYSITFLDQFMEKTGTEERV